MHWVSSAEAFFADLSLIMPSARLAQVAKIRRLRRIVLAGVAVAAIVVAGLSLYNVSTRYPYIAIILTEHGLGLDGGASKSETTNDTILEEEDGWTSA